MGHDRAQDSVIELKLPPDFDEDEPHIDMKGCYFGARLVDTSSGNEYPIMFYDPTRLAQDVESELAGGFFFDVAVCVIPEVSEAEMRKAVSKMTAWHIRGLRAIDMDHSGD